MSELPTEQIKAGEDPRRTLRVVGNTDDLEPPAIYLYLDWLPATGKKARDSRYIANR